MSDSTFFVSAAAVRNLKQSAQHRARSVSSSHLSEALAAALGFKTHAALRAALADLACAAEQLLLSHRTQNELVRHRQHLEDIVAQRTAELSRAVTAAKAWRIPGVGCYPA